MTRPPIIRNQKQFMRVLVGTLFLFVAILAYRSYGELFHSRAATPCSLSRLQITQFKPIYDREILAMSSQASEYVQAQNTGNGGLYLIDVRSAASFVDGHIRGAISIPEPELEARISSVVSPERADALICAILCLTGGAYERPCGAPSRTDEIQVRVRIGWRVEGMAA